MWTEPERALRAPIESCSHRANGAARAGARTRPLLRPRRLFSRAPLRSLLGTGFRHGRLNSSTLPDESLIDEMRAALRSDRERAESRHSRDGAATPAVEQPPASP